MPIHQYLILVEFFQFLREVVQVSILDYQYLIISHQTQGHTRKNLLPFFHKIVDPSYNLEPPLFAEKVRNKVRIVQN